MNNLQLVSLLATGNLGELGLGDTTHEPAQAGKHLVRVLQVQGVPLRQLDQLLDARQAVADEVLAELVVNLLEDEAAELFVVALFHVKDLVDEARLEQLVAGDAAAHDEGLVGLADAEAADEGARGAALGHEPEGGKGREQKGVGRRVDEVGVGGQGGRQADDGPVEPDDQDLGVRVKGLRRVEVVGDKGTQPLKVRVRVCGHALAKGDVGAAELWQIVSVTKVIIQP